MTTIDDLDNVDNCPIGFRCESCGIESSDLTVEPIDVRLGIACMTICADCFASEITPPITVGTAARLVGQHCGHLGIDLDEMAAILRGAQ